jgi:hypothetical protein
LTSLFEEFPNTYSQEAFKAIIPPIIKPGRIFKFQSANKKPFKQLLMLKQFSDIAFFPLVTDSHQVMQEVIKCFGTSTYSRMISNYIYPKMFKYKNPYIPGSKVILRRSDRNQYVSEVKAQLPKLINIPSFTVRNKRNSVIDMSQVINLTMPTRQMLSRPTVLQVAESVPLQIISRLLLKNIPEEQGLFKNFLITLPPAADIFNNLIISIPVNLKEIRAVNQFLNPSVKIPINFKRNPDTIFTIGIMRFLLKVIDNNFLEYTELERAMADIISRKEHVIFLFHNDTHAFYLDPCEIREKELKYEFIFRLCKLSLKIITSINNRSLSPLEVDTESETEPEELEKAIDEKIQVNEKIVEKASSEINQDKDESKEENESPKEPVKTDIKKAIAQGKANMMNQKSLGLDTSEKNKKIDAIVYHKDEQYNIDALQEAYKKDEDKFYEDIEEYSDGVDDVSEMDTAEYDSEDTTEEDTEREEVKEFLGELESSNDEESQKKLIEQIKSSSTPPLTAAEKRRLDALHNKYKSIRYEDNRTLEEILEDTTTQTIDIDKSNVAIKDDSFNYSVLKDFTSSYIHKTMSRDIVKTIKFFSEDKSLNMHITGFEKKDSSDQLNKVSTYVFTLEDDHKQKHRIRFKLPDIDEDGFMFINGNKKYLKKQLVLRPVTKTKEDEVYLTSDLNKVRLYRQGTVLNRNIVILKKIMKNILTELKNENFNGELSKKVNVLRGNNSLVNNDYITTIEYDALASYLHYIILHPNKPEQVAFYFNQANIREEIKKHSIEYKFLPNATPIGIDFKSMKVIDVKSLDSRDSAAEKIIKYVVKSGVLPDIDTLIKNTSVPSRKMYSRLELQSKDAPLIVFLSSLFDFSKVLSVSGIKTYFIKNKENLPEGINENELIPIRFADGTLFYNQYPIENALLLNGLGELDTLAIEYAELDNIATYLDWIYDNYKTRNLYKGWTAFHELFLNPKTVECLNALQQPTDFLELFLYANGLLANNSYLDSADSRNWRIRDYEMINSMLYESISKEYRIYKQKGKRREGFSIPENDVLKTINKSFVISGYDATNPLNELRERSSVTYKGPKGINSNRALSLEKRGQTRSTTGTIGISSIDNGNVGIVKQLTINPRIINTLGFVDSPETDADMKKIPTSSLMTAEESMLPFVNRDDPKRIGFASGQTKHVIPSDHFTPQIVGTGFEQSVVFKIGNDFGYKAREDGEIVGVNEKSSFALIRYKDNSVERVEFGSRYHRNSDFFLSNNLALAVKPGDLVKKGELITYNKDFFKKHLGKLMYTQGVVTRVAITEGEVTEEDSSAITQRLANKLTSSVIKRNQIVISANSNIIRSVNIGDRVIYGDSLLVFEDQKDSSTDTSIFNIFGETDEKILDTISRHKSSAHATGEIIDIKMYWTVSPDQMSDSCSAFVNKYIRKIKKDISFEENTTKTKSKKIVETQVTTPVLDRINGMEMPRDGGILVEYYIKHTDSKRSGDKVTLNSSLKSILCQIIPDDLAPRRLNGRFKQIDMIFSFIGINARQVTSIWFTGYISKILFEEGKNFAKQFFDEIGEDPASIVESNLVSIPN